VLGRGIQHPAKQLAVLSLQLGLLAEGLPGAGDPFRQRVAHPLQLPQARDPRLAVRGDDTGLEASDLTAQLGASEALVAPHSKRIGCVSFEQIQHGPFECRSRRRGRKR
jgi:hypothetical protein